MKKHFLLQTLIKLHKDQPIDMTADSLTELNYELSVYNKGSMWMKQLEESLGTALFDSSMHYYYNQWKFKHPYPIDFKKSIEAASNTNYRYTISKVVYHRFAYPAPQKT